MIQQAIAYGITDMLTDIQFKHISSVSAECDDGLKYGDHYDMAVITWTVFLGQTRNNRMWSLVEVSLHDDHAMVKSRATPDSQQWLINMELEYANPNMLDQLLVCIRDITNNYT